MIRVLVWNENYHEKKNEKVRAIYPDGMHNAIADFLRCDDITVRTATLQEEHNGVTKEVLDETDVLIWWGHVCHGEVSDEATALVRQAVLDIL